MYVVAFSIVFWRSIKKLAELNAASGKTPTVWLCVSSKRELIICARLRRAEGKYAWLLLPSLAHLTRVPRAIRKCTSVFKLTICFFISHERQTISYVYNKALNYS